MIVWQTRNHNGEVSAYTSFFVVKIFGSTLDGLLHVSTWTSLQNNFSCVRKVFPAKMRISSDYPRTCSTPEKGANSAGKRWKLAGLAFSRAFR